MESKLSLTAKMVATTQAVREKVSIATAAEDASPEERLPLVLDALEAAVAAMDAMTDRMLADVG